MTARQVWRETTALFWNHSALWLPVLGADLLSFLFTKVLRQVGRWMTSHLLLGQQPVFGGKQSLPAPSDPSFHAFFVKGAVIAAIVEWGMYFIQIILYTIAFFTIVALVRSIQERNEPSFPSAIQFVKSKWSPIFGLSLRVLGFVALLAILLVSTIGVAVPRHALPKPYIAWYVFACTGFCVIAYLIVPTATRRIVAEGTHSLTPEQIRQGRILALLAVIASSLLGYFLPYLASSFEREQLFQSAHAVTTLSAIGSLLTAAPYILLFIALTLVVDNELNDVAAIQRASSEV